MSIKENKAITRRFWEEVFNERKLAVIDELFTTDYIYRGAAGLDVHGQEGLKQFLANYFNAFPDLYVKIEDMIAEKDKVVSRVMCSGTHTGELMGIAPTHKQVTITVICVDRLLDDKIAESWELVDMYGMFQQLGIIPAIGK